MRKVVLSTDEFNNVKDDAMKSEPKSLKIRMADIEFSNLSITDNVIDIKGKPIAVNKHTIANYLKLVGINPKLINDVKTDEQGKKNLSTIVNILNEQKVKQENRELRLLVSQQNEVIDLVSNEICGRISNKNFFNIAEQVADRYGLGIIDTSINKSNGIVALNLVAPNTKVIANISEETMQFGLKLTNNLYSTEIADFNYRLICTNGMTATDTYSAMKLENLNPSEIDKVFNHIKRMADNDFVPKDFDKLLLMARDTTASINEVENGIFSIFNRMNLPLDLEQSDKDILFSKFINTHFPEYAIRKAELMAKGYDLEKMTPNDKKFVNGKMTIWDLVNRVTYFASNRQSEVQDTEKLQIIGGGILTNKSHDLASNRITLLSL